MLSEECRMLFSSVLNRKSNLKWKRKIIIKERNSKLWHCRYNIHIKLKIV